MGRKEELIAEILDLEWEMFASLRAEGETASCQEDPGTFRLMRTASFLTWSETTLASYLTDLRLAAARGRNLMAEKYARMQGSVPALNPEAAPLIERIVRIECRWAEEFLRKNPGERLGRPIYARDEAPGRISSETYSRCELETYSMRTLDYYYGDVLAMSARGENRVESIARHIRELAGEGRE